MTSQMLKMLFDLSRKRLVISKFTRQLRENSESIDSFWKFVQKPKTGYKLLYGVNQDGSLFDTYNNIFNLASLKTILDDTILKFDQLLPGIHTPYLYFGSTYSGFPWVYTNINLYYSINFIIVLII